LTTSLEAQVREYCRWQSSPEIYRICTRIARGRIKAARTVITVCALETCCGKGSAVGRLNFKEGVSFLLAEQNTNMALKYASYGYILENGRVVMDGEARALAANEDVKEFYLGVAGEKRKSFRYVKHYKRRKRWLI
jgi:hypothetical protein